MSDLYSMELGSAGGDSGTIIVNEYVPKDGLGTGHVNLTYVFGDGSSVTYGNNINFGTPNFSGGVRIEDGTLAAGLADGSVTRHAFTVDANHFYASLQDIQRLAQESSMGEGSYNLYGQNCVDTLRRETHIAGLPDPADILAGHTAVTYYAQHTSTLAGVVMMDLELGVPIDIRIAAYLAGNQIGQAINGISDLVDTAFGMPVGMNPYLSSDSIFLTPDYGANAVILSTDANSIVQFVNDSNVFQIPAELYQGELQGLPDWVLVDTAASHAQDADMAAIDASLYGDGWGGYNNWGGDAFAGF